MNNFWKILFYAQRPANGYSWYFSYKTSFKWSFYLCWIDLYFTGTASVAGRFSASCDVILKIWDTLKNCRQILKDHILWSGTPKMLFLVGIAQNVLIYTLSVKNKILYFTSIWNCFGIFCLGNVNACSLTMHKMILNELYKSFILAIESA